IRVYYWLLLIVEIAAAVIILDVFVSDRSRMTSLLSMRPIVWLGRVSYGLYLWHYPVYRTMESLGYVGATAIYGTALTVVIASVSYYLVERPLLKLKRYPATSARAPVPRFSDPLLVR